MKKTITIMCALALASVFAATTPTVPTLSELAERVTAISDRYAATTNTLNAYRLENTQLLESISMLHGQFAVFSNAVTMIERKCETDPVWRRAYHQGLAAQTVCTNEYGIIYRVDIFQDGYVYADYKSHTPELPDPEAEERQKALIAQKREEAIAAMERANLPARVAEILAARRAAAATTNEVSVTVTP